MVIRLDISHTKGLANVLSRAFSGEPHFTYLVPDEKARRDALPWFLSAAIRASHLYGENYTTRIWRAALSGFVRVAPSAFVESCKGNCSRCPLS